MTWTYKSVDRLMELSNTELSASKIAIELGTTKNAVLGKLHRIKLKNGYIVTKPKYIRTRKKFSTSHFKKYGQEICIICKKMFTSYSKYDRFCDKCKRCSPYTDY